MEAWNPFLLAPKSAPNRHLKLLFLPREIVGLYAAPMPNVLELLKLAVHTLFHTGQVAYAVASGI